MTDVELPDLPWLAPYDEARPDPAPPAERLAAEPYAVTAARHLRAGSSYPCAVAGINLDSWTSPSSRGWGQSCHVPLATITLDGGARVTVHAALAELAGLIMRANEAQGYAYRAADTGGYNCRAIAGTTDPSWHAWGLAIDCDWTTNPSAPCPVRTDRPGWEIQRWNRYGWGWGGDYDCSNPPDSMHVEFHGTPAQAAAALTLARAELGALPRPPAPKPPAPPAPSSQAKTDQWNLRDTGFDPGAIDGIWGPSSRAACERFQTAARIAVDGICGDNTRAALRMVPSWHTAPDRAGDGGYAARLWQQKLHDHGWRIELDGIWGAHSASILRQFQADKGLRADGIRGPQSWTCLYCTTN